MRRFFLPPQDCRANTLRLEGREARHAIRVLRLKAGDEAVVLDGAGGEFACEVASVSGQSAALAVNKRVFAPPPPCSVTLLVGIPKGKIIEAIIQKSVELGARRIIPLTTERVVMRLDERNGGQKSKQWLQTAVEAIKQCGAVWLPEIERPMTIESFLARKERFDLQLVGSLQKERRNAQDVLRRFEKENGRIPARIAVWVGPEGDFTLAELKAIETSGAQGVSLGPLVLRVETAAVYFLSIINYEFSK